MIRNILSKSEDDTRNLAVELAESSRPGDVFALTGDLGSGKTLFTKAFASALGIEEEITSPTFNLLEEYENDIPFYHFDLYRIENESELDMLYFEDYWESEGISVIEWAERAMNRLPDKCIKINFTYIDESQRRIKIEYPDN